MNLWQREDFQRAAGETLRPGGLDLTRRGLDLCARHCGLASGARVLDLGCGTGATLHLLQEEGYQAFGVDSGVFLAWRGRAVNAVRADITRLPLANAVMDAAVCECVLSLLFPPRTALEEWRRVLRPGGTLLLTEFFVRDPIAACGARCPHTGLHSKKFEQTSPCAGSCLDGAHTVAEWNALLAQAGFFLHAHEDHSAGLAALAARMLWYGQRDLTEAFGFYSSGGACENRYGYGLWIAQKETPCTLS